MTIIDLFNFSNIPSKLCLKVTTKAKNKSIKIEEQEDGSKIYKVYVTEAPENGKANKAVISLLAKEMNIPKSAFTIEHGLTSRFKIITINETLAKVSDK